MAQHSEDRLMWVQLTGLFYMQATAHESAPLLELGWGFMEPCFIHLGRCHTQNKKQTINSETENTNKSTKANINMFCPLGRLRCPRQPKMTQFKILDPRFHLLYEYTLYSRFSDRNWAAVAIRSL